MAERLRHYSDSVDEPVYFYGGWASSFAPWQILAYPMRTSVRPTVLRETTFATREHWFAAHKTLVPSVFQFIAESPYAETAKKRGRDTPLRRGWDDGISFAVMVEGIRHQAKRHLALREKLLATGDRLLAEDSPWDYIWGIRDEHGGMTGRNLLGKAWMVVREELCT